MSTGRFQPAGEEGPVLGFLYWKRVDHAKSEEPFTLIREAAVPDVVSGTHHEEFTTTGTDERSLPAVTLKVVLPPESVEKLVSLVRDAVETSLAQVADQARASMPRATDEREAGPLSVSVSPGTEVSAADKLHAADLRMAILLGKVPDDTGLLIDIKTLGRLLQISSRHLNRLIDLKAVPEPIRLGRSLRWRLSEILEWIEADCLPQQYLTYGAKVSSAYVG